MPSILPSIFKNIDIIIIMATTTSSTVAKLKSCGSNPSNQIIDLTDKQKAIDPGKRG
jgi:hypothetical protein